MATNPLTTSAGSIAGLLWPTRSDNSSRLLRAIVLVVVGSALLTLSAKVQVPFWPVPMTLQTLAVLALGALFGRGVAVAAVLAYLAQGAMGLPVFANTPPAVAGPLYLLGPTGGFLLGFVVAAFVVGSATDRGWASRPLAFAAAVLAADVMLLTLGLVWLALFATLPSGAMGIGFAKAFAAGVQPFILGEIVKVALVAVAIPLVYRGIGKRA
jgi:biotin transport system substrate-specific component